MKLNTPLPSSCCWGLIVLAAVVTAWGCSQKERPDDTNSLSSKSAVETTDESTSGSTSPASGGDSTTESDARISTEAVEDKGFLAIFEDGLPQSTISNRMDIYFERFHNTVDKSELVHFGSAGLMIYPPAGFVKSDRFNGFEDPETGSNIMIITNPFSMEGETKTIIDQAAKAKNSGVLFTRNIMNDDKQGIFYATREKFGSEREIAKYTMAFGDDEFSWVVTGAFRPEEEQKCGEEFLKSVLNARISNQPRLPAGEDVEFTIQPNRLELTDGFVDKLVFTLGGDFPVDTTKQPVFQASKLPLKWFSLGKEGAARSLMQPSPLFEIQAVSSKHEVLIDDLEGFEFVGIGRDTTNNEPLQMYSVTLFTDEVTYIMNGWVSSDNSESYISDFRALAKSFKRKER